jgi:cobalt/nickel transport system ATP-binding protein
VREASEILRLSGIRFRHSAPRAVLDDVNLTIRSGERVGLVGLIGCGKTTLLHIIVGLLNPHAGQISAFGRVRASERDFWEVRERVGLLFQDPDDQLFCPSVAEDVAFGPLNQGKPLAQVAGAVSRALERVGLEGFEERITHHLSGGEKRLVSLATLLAMEPDILLLDEPENGLDPESYERLQGLLCTLPQAMIVVSHNHDFIRSVTARCLRLESGSLVAC